MKIFNKVGKAHFYVVLVFLLFLSSKVLSQTPGGSGLITEIWLSADKVNGPGIALPSNGASVTSWKPAVTGLGREYVKNRHSNNRYNNTPSFKSSVNTLMNFQPSLNFGDDTSKLVNATELLDPTKAYYVFYVSNNNDSGNNRTLFSFNSNNATIRNNNVGWYGGAPYFSMGGTAARNRKVHQGNGKSYGINAAIMPNISPAGLTPPRSYLNGVANIANFGSGTIVLATGTHNMSVIGNANYDNDYPFTGDIQEIIVLSANRGTDISSLNLAKINSYLAIKYGISLEGVDYINSDGGKVWDRTLYPEYNHNIIGLARDDASGLYQKQAKSTDENELTIYLGDKLYPLNINNPSELLNDKDYILLGSNNRSDYIPYAYKAGEANFINASLGEETNFRYGLTFRVQTNASSGFDINIDSEFTYVLVSSNDPTFSPDKTRIYRPEAGPIRINNGDYISFATFEGVPGGLKNDLELWLSADMLLGKSSKLPNDQSDVTEWRDLSEYNRRFAKYGVHTVPRLSYAGINYNPSLEFYQDGDDNLTDADRQRKLVSVDEFFVDPAKSYYTFWVSEVDGELSGATGTVFTFDGNTSRSNDHSWQARRSSDNAPVVSMSTSTGTASAGVVVHPTRGLSVGINSIMRPNTNGVNQRQYFDGVGNSFSGRRMNSTNNYSVIGNSIYGTNTSTTNGIDNPFFGDLQEVVVYSGNAGEDIPSDDLQKIHSYLAIKYGISLDGQDLITSKNVKVWNGLGSKNEGFNNHVFGIGRDKPAALYVKQAASATYRSISVFVGDELADLNKNNTSGKIPEDVFVMFGSNNSSGMIDYRYEPEDNPPFIGQELDEPVNFRDGVILKTQLTNAASFDLKISGPGSFILVSPNDKTFAAENTRLYKVDHDTGYAEITVNDGDYVGFAYFASGPGGVIKGLRMWLDAGSMENIKINGSDDVVSWRDKSSISNTSYTFQSVNSANRAPGYEQSSLFTNFHPSVNFRANGQYLTTNRGPTTVASPRQYTVFNVVYNDFIKANRSYFMSWGSKASNSSARRPTFGMRGYSGGIRGRLYESGGSAGVEGNEYIFQAGATSINIQTVNVPERQVIFESNGVQNIRRSNSSLGNGSRMNGVGVIGGGSRADWQLNGVIAQSIFYEGLLTDEEKERVYSYLGMMYASTLKIPSAFNYRLSDNVTSVWDGTSAPFSEFHNNVAGLVRDDASDFHNNMSRSTDVGSLITMMLRGHDPATGQGEKPLLESDFEYLFWGNNGKSGSYTFTAQELEDICGSATSKTNKIWLVNKSPEMDNIAVDIRIEGTNDFPYASSGYEIVLLIADSKEKIENNNWDLEIPSSFLKDEEQHSIGFTFSSDKTYFSLGVKQLPGTCETCEFDGRKTIDFDRNTWFPHGTLENNINLGVNNPEIGDNFTVNVKTYLEGGATWTRRYPRYSSRKSLRLRRRGATAPKMVTEITPSVAAATQFQIYNLDREGGRYKEVEIYGICEDGTVLPALTPANSRRSSFDILGNRAVAKRRPISSYTGSSGMLNVVFDYPVEKIIIKEHATGSRSGTQYIGIGPIGFSCPAPRPPYNEAGIAMSKQATDEVLLCGSSVVDYTFRVFSGSCDRKGVSISDTLPANLSWDLDMISIADIAIADDTEIKVSADGKVLQIDNLIIPGSSDPFIFTAQAMFSKDAQPGIYENQAWLQTSIIINDIPTIIDPLPSADFYRGEGFKSLTTAIDGGVRFDPVTVNVDHAACYGSESEVKITLNIDNPNPNPVTEMFFAVDFNEEFKYVMNSLNSSISSVGKNPEFEEENGVNLPGSFFFEGFTLPAGESTISFIVKAPITEELVGEVDRDGNPIGWEGEILTPPFNPEDQARTDLVVSYDLSTEMDDECTSTSFDKANGDVIVHNCRSKAFIIINSNVTNEVKK